MVMVVGGSVASKGRVVVVGASVRPSAEWVLPAEPSAVTVLRRRGTGSVRRLARRRDRLLPLCRVGAEDSV